ncbi:MAG: hybrid sensor histidine kinase/response regulator [Myxococcales bacterium]|nr:hybrid sensor histidine kinase/response regulator [Myxococcales bacterium]
MTTQTAATRARAVEPPVVLCVDDERFVLRSLREQLRRGLSQTCTVEVAESGEEALELVEELTGEGAALAVVISDHLMPRMKGDELLTRIHARSPDTLTVLLTGQASAEAVGNAVNHASLYRYIEKPWQSADLLITIEQALDSFLTEQELRDTSLRLRRSQEVVRQLADTKRELESRMRELSGALVELRATQRRLVEAEKMAALGGLVAGVAHEINTPLGIGITAASLLRDKTSAFVGSYRRGGVTRNELERYLGTADESCLLILRNLERAAALVRDFKQVAVDQSSEAKREFVVKDYLGTIVQGLSPALRRTSHAVEIVGDERHTLHSYPGALSQIITNLVMNSLVHAFAADERGRVVIEFWSAPGGALLLRYSDNGRGIGSDSIKKIFDPFFTTNRGNGSSGLGLHIVYNLVVQKLRGAIRCDSAVGDGTVFTITLPRDAGPVGTIENTPEPAKM